jgi:aspartyl aminopeptidase
MDFELSLCDTQPPQVWGLHNEFLSSPRLDNQVHCFTSLCALIEHANAADLEGASRGGQTDVAMIALFDHEEVGSESTCGAGGPVMAEALTRVALCFPPKTAGVSEEEALLRTKRKSFLISADVAHAIHPNWPGKHEANHAPKLNGGTVIKTNDNQRYATNAPTGFVVRELARRSGTSVQEFMVRNDCPCGTTIGPIIAANTGVRTVDVGVPSLSMHSIRETVGTDDVRSSFVLFSSFFRLFRELDDACKF